MTINPHLNYDGRCEEAFKYYQQTFGGKIDTMFKFGDTPAAGSIPEGFKDKVMHTSMVVGGNILMGCDAPPGYFDQPQGFSVSVVVDSAAEAERVFASLSLNGDVKMPMEETFWAIRFGMCVDQFGIPWMVNCMKQP